MAAVQNFTVDLPVAVQHAIEREFLAGTLRGDVSHAFPEIGTAMEFNE